MQIHKPDRLALRSGQLTQGVHHVPVAKQGYRLLCTARGKDTTGGRAAPLPPRALFAAHGADRALVNNAEQVAVQALVTRP